jgi:radical SAM protein with 4Fe4S-binding SPASM domain
LSLQEQTFKKVYIEISNICNLQCTFCPVVDRDKKVMTLDFLRQTLRQVKPHAERVCYHVMGEPLNHPHFSEAVQLAEEEGVSLEITTNGTLLTEQLQKVLLSPAIAQVNFSLQSFVDNFPKADPKTYFAKILQFCSLAELQRPDLYVNFRFWNLQPNEIQNEINEFFLTTIEKTYSVEINRRVDPAFNKSKKVRGRLYLHFDSRFEWPNKNGEILQTQGTCWGARSQLAIHANGLVVPCCLDKEADVVLGDLTAETFQQVLQSNAYVSIKEGFEKNELRADLCRRCSFRQRF